MLMTKNPLPTMRTDGYKALFETLYPPLCLFANTYLHDREGAEDVVQEVFIKIWEQKTSYINFSAAKSYLYTSVRHRCLDVLKSSYHKHRVPMCEWGFETMVGDDFFMTQLTVADTYAQLDRAIRQLPKKSEAIIRLSLQAHTNAEIADILSISKNTVKSQKRLAYEKLRASLAGLLHDI